MHRNQATALRVVITGAEDRRHRVATTVEEVALRRVATMEVVEVRAHHEAIPVAEVAEDHMAEAVVAAVATPTVEAIRAWRPNAKYVRPRYFRGRSVPSDSDSLAVKKLRATGRKQIESGAQMFTHPRPL